MTGATPAAAREHARRSEDRARRAGQVPARLVIRHASAEAPIEAIVVIDGRQSAAELPPLTAIRRGLELVQAGLRQMDGRDRAALRKSIGTMINRVGAAQSGDRR